MMRGAVRWAALCVLGGATPAMADLGDEIAGLLRSRDCRMAVEALSQVFATMGRSEEDIAAALGEMGRAGEATVLAGRVTLSAQACAAPRRRTVPEAVPWIEGRIAEGTGCRLPRAAVEAGAEAVGLRAEQVGAVLGDLMALGRVVAEGEDLALRGDLCGPNRPRDWQLDRILSLGLTSYRAVIGLLAHETRCRIDTTDPAALGVGLGDTAKRHLLLGSDLSPEAEAALRLKVEQALADPGPAYRVEPGEIVARYCLP